MPTYRSITISLQSQYDALTIPEFAPPAGDSAPPAGDSAPATPPRRRHADARSSASFSSPTPPRVAAVYVPIYSGSQFWINYACPTSKDTETKYFYFKLFVKGRCLLSWGIGQDENMSGRVTYGIFDGGTDFHGKRVLEKRAFFFQNSGANQRRGGNFEIQVFRSKARKREPARFEKFSLGEEDEVQNGFNISASGRIKKGDPRKMYTYALLDPVDQPFATFKYYCRTGTQLRELAITLPGDEDIEDITAASPSRKDRPQISPMDFSPPTREYAAPARPSLDSPGKAMHPLSIAPPCMRLSPTKMRGFTTSPSKRDVGTGPHQDFLRDIGGLSLGETRNENRAEIFDIAEWNAGRVSPSKQHEDVERNSGASMARSLSSAVRSLRRRVGSREEQRT